MSTATKTRTFVIAVLTIAASGLAFVRPDLIWWIIGAYFIFVYWIHRKENK